jgi:hypothetical protein
MRMIIKENKNSEIWQLGKRIWVLTVKYLSLKEVIINLKFLYCKEVGFKILINFLNFMISSGQLK